MEKRSHGRIRDLVAHTAFKGLDANEIGWVRISIMARSKSLRSKGRIQMSETSHIQISHIQLATHGRSIQKCQQRKSAMRCGHSRFSFSVPVAPRIARNCRLPDLRRRCRIAPSEFAIEIRKVSEPHIKRHNANIAIGKAWVAQHPMR